MTRRRCLVAAILFFGLAFAALAVSAFGQNIAPAAAAANLPVLAQAQVTPQAPPATPPATVPTITLRRFTDPLTVLSAPVPAAEQAMKELADLLARNHCTLEAGILIAADDTKRPYVRVVPIVGPGDGT